MSLLSVYQRIFKIKKWSTAWKQTPVRLQEQQQLTPQSNPSINMTWNCSHFTSQAKCLKRATKYIFSKDYKYLHTSFWKENHVCMYHTFASSDKGLWQALKGKNWVISLSKELQGRGINVFRQRHNGCNKSSCPSRKWWLYGLPVNKHAFREDTVSVCMCVMTGHGQWQIAII